MLYVFGRDEDVKMLSLIDSAIMGTNSVSASACSRLLKTRWLVRWFVLRKIRNELEAAGLYVEGQAIDWDAIGDFIVKIAPIILEFLSLFL